jgi:hypothetical protein
MRFIVGDRVVLVHMADDPDPVPAGTVGTVTYVHEFRWPGTPDQLQVSVDWDNGRRLSALVPPDVIVREDPSLP